MTNAIPEITHKWGSSWMQPKDIREAPMDDTHVLLTRHQFNHLLSYNSSNPTGVYDGKCWMRKAKGKRFLMWYGRYGRDPKNCSINHRIIVIGRLKPKPELAPRQQPFYAEH